MDRAIARLDSARKELLGRPGVIGVGYGFKEKDGRILENIPALVVYVQEKKDKKNLNQKEIIPSHIDEVPTDVVQFGQRTSPVHHRNDGMWLDQGKIHDTNPHKELFLEPRADQNVDHVAVLEIDNTFVNGNNIDFVKAVKRFLTAHPDAFDFITFYVDTSTGLPGQGSYHSGVYNKTTGINYYAGGNLDSRATYGSQKLLAIQSMGWLGNQVLLQEVGHMWAAYVRNRDTQNGANRYDLLIGSSGQDMFHWGRFFDADHTPMDYDGIDWEALGGNQFQSHAIADDFYAFHPLDLYLMGLIPSSQVGSFYVIQNPSGQSGTITGTSKSIGVQNVIWAEGDRNPAYPNTQMVWKHAFVVLTKNAAASQSFVQQVAQQRRAFTWQFYKATRFLGRVDTTLSAGTAFPAIQNISVAADNDRALVGWTTSTPTKGRVNYATSPAAFDRQRAHSSPFSTVSETSFGTSHGVLLTGLTPNSTYYFEVVAETPEGLVDRVGTQQIYTRKTNDTCAPDINNVSVQLVGKDIFVKWKTDEACDSRVKYGTTTPPALTRSDPYPTTNHSVVLSGLSAGAYKISVASQDAAGNLTVDNNSGAYYQATVPMAGPPLMASAQLRELSHEIAQINLEVDAGNIDQAEEKTTRLISTIAERELKSLSKDIPGDPLEASFQALSILAQRLGGALEMYAGTSEYIDFTAVNQPLNSLTCINLPAETVEREGSAVADALAQVYPGLMLEPHPSLRTSEFRLKRC